jgi:hypothetical protein
MSGDGTMCAWSRRAHILTNVSLSGARPRKPTYPKSDSTTKEVKLAHEFALSRSGGWILCAGKVLDSKEGFAHLWSTSSLVFSLYFKRQGNDWGMWAATINSSQDVFHGAILIRSVDHAFKTYE